MDEIFGLIVVLGIVGVAAWVGLRSISGLWLRFVAGLVTVYEHEFALEFDRGRFVRLLGPGRYITWPSPREIIRHDRREQSLSIPGQEILTQDALPVRVSLEIRYRIADPLAYRRETTQPVMRLYAAGQAVLRDRIGAAPVDALLAERDRLDAGLGDAIAAQIEGIGLAVLSAAVRDFSLTGPAKQAFADLWKAQKEGLAALERARGEQAALRALANAARMLKGNPELMNLRILQALSARPGQAPPTVVLGGAAGLTPIPSAPPGGDGASDADPQ